MADSSTLQRAYEAATRGGTPPTMAVTSGAVLNAMLKVTDYDPRCAYLVTETGIERLPDEDEHDG